VKKSKLRRLIARGSARSFTHLYGEHDTTSGPSLNYSRGKVIDILLGGDKVENVIVSGRADGVQLEPKPPAPADSTKKKPTLADTTKKKPTPADTTKKKPRP
jgi:hypothetical protein